MQPCAMPPMSTLDRLRALPPLRGFDQGAATRCKMCGGRTAPFCTIDFNRPCGGVDVFEPANIPVPYVRCVACECLFTSFCDDWTGQDFADLIYNDQYILVDGEYDGTRARRDAEYMAGFLAGAERMRLLDYGAGLGHFAAAMGERGFVHTASYDPFSHPERPAGPFDIITCFETIEHSPDPAATIRDMLSFMAPDGCLLIGQALQPDDIEEQGASWWYLAPRNGHISTFSYETIRAFAEAEGLLFENIGGPFALSRPGRAGFFADLFAPRVGRSNRLMLFAPPAGAPGEEGWLPDEHTILSERFRWTGAADVSLGTIDPEGGVDLIVPLIHAVQPWVAREAALMVGDRHLPLRRRRNELAVRFEPEGSGPFAVRLVTPAPLVPRSWGEADDRALGLAIPYPPPAPVLNPIRTNHWPAPVAEPEPEERPATIPPAPSPDRRRCWFGWSRRRGRTPA